jgi:hypothetical protein
MSCHLGLVEVKEGGCERVFDGGVYLLFGLWGLVALGGAEAAGFGELLVMT